jgi:hypothetical protein
MVWRNSHLRQLNFRGGFPVDERRLAFLAVPVTSDAIRAQLIPNRATFVRA